MIDYVFVLANINNSNNVHGKITCMNSLNHGNLTLDELKKKNKKC